MTINATKTVSELATEIPGSTRVFEKVGIDYCCGGGKTIGEACAAAGISIDDLSGALEKTVGAEPDSDWSAASLSQLISHIITKHHVFTCEELARLDELIKKVCSVHGQNHSELSIIQSCFAQLKNDLIPHMQKEEMVLFPFIEQMDAAVSAGGRAPRPFFGTVQNPVRMMMLEHDRAGDLLKQIRKASNNFTIPPDVCLSYSTLYQSLESLERDLHEHIHLENNILFPRAIKMENGLD